jgi:CBS domain-containing protein
MTSHGVDAVAVTRDEQLIGLVTAVDVVRSLTAHRTAPLDAAT